MLPEPRPPAADDVRLYVDEDMLGVGYGLMWLRPDVVTCGVGPFADELRRGLYDVDWIPMVAARGLVAITSNHKIRTNPVEAGVAVSAGARIVGLAGRAAQRTSWERVQLLARHWQAIDGHVLARPEGPWWLAVTQGGVREMDYLC